MAKYEKVATTQEKVTLALREAGFEKDLSKHLEELVQGISNPYDRLIASYLAEILDVETSEILKDCRKLGISPFHLLLTSYDIQCRGATNMLKKAEAYFELGGWRRCRR